MSDSPKNGWPLACGAFLVTAVTGYGVAHALFPSPAAKEVRNPSPVPVQTAGEERHAENSGDSSVEEILTAKLIEEKDPVKRLLGLADLAGIHTLAPGGRLEPGMAELLGLNAQQAQQADRSLHNAWKLSTKGISERLKVTPRSLNEEAANREKSSGLAGAPTDKSRIVVTKIDDFEIPPAEDHGAAMLTQLRDELLATAGPVATEVLMNEPSFDLGMGGAGKYEIHGSVSTGQRFGLPGQAISMEMKLDGAEPRMRMNECRPMDVRVLLGPGLDALLMNDQ